MGTLKVISTKQQYTKYTYTYNSTTYNNIHTFTTKSGTQSIMPAFAYPRKILASMNPATVSATNIIAKTNGGVFDLLTNAYYGLFYQGSGHPVYAHGFTYNNISHIPDSNPIFGGMYWPSFCVKKDGTAIIRWFANPSKLQEAAPYCQCIIGAAHPLVFSGKNVMVQSVYDTDGVRICDPSNLSSIHARFRGGDCKPTQNEKRTLLGHKAGNAGVYVMVCVDSGMPLKAAAALMVDLGCDFAVNMDGGGSTEMRIKDGYGASGAVTSGNGRALPTAVCAFTKM